ALYFVADLAHPQTLSQLVNIVTGTSYTFGFDVYLPQNGANNGNDATLSATVGGLTFADFAASATPATTWMHFAGAGTAAITGPVTFEFDFNSFGQPAKDFVVDRVYFAPTADVGGVPEPATWAMMLVGFGGLGACLRRRRAGMALAAA
ncbi:MAG TPA: PEPxxWA-CTERM sorting domain-containing protein, partial [Phenylobacterium sp.]|nr:PEPxxWA-CTERM sorting domain-containing protein [Phenylobacterium sp.]